MQLMGQVELESGDATPCSLLPFRVLPRMGLPLPRESAEGCSGDSGWEGVGQHSPGQVHHGLQDVVTQGSTALFKGDP